MLCFVNMELLLCTVLLVTVLAIIPELLPGLARFLTSLFVKTSRSNELKIKLRELQNQISSINMVDEFPTYARVERKLKALNAELAEIKKSWSSMFLKTKLGVNIVNQILQSLCLIVVIYNYGRLPVITLPEHWLYPFGPMFAFRTGVQGAVSTTCWLLVCRSAVGKIVQLRHH